MKDCILILSGGLDSTTLLYDYQERIALAISFDYGSNHNAKEIPFARLPFSLAMKLSQKDTMLMRT